LQVFDKKQHAVVGVFFLLRCRVFQLYSFSADPEIMGMPQLVPPLAEALKYFIYSH